MPCGPRSCIFALTALVACADGTAEDVGDTGGESAATTADASSASTTAGSGSVDDTTAGDSGNGSCDGDPLIWEVISYLGADVEVDADGNIYVGGTTGPQGGGNADFTVVSLGPDGTERWSVNFNGAGNYGDLAKDVAIAADGAIHVVGGVDQGEPFGGDAAAHYVYAADGTELSAGANDDAGWYEAVATGLTDAVAVGGWQGLTHSGGGVEAWSVMPVGEIQGLAITADGSIAAVGMIFVDGTQHGWAARYDVAGTETWSYTATEPGGQFEAVAIDTQDRIVAVGRKNGQGETQRPLVLRFAGNGTPEWAGPVDEAEGHAFDIAIAPDGGIVVGGWIEPPGMVDGPWMRKYGPDDAVVWTRSALAATDEPPQIDGLAVAPDGSVLAVAGDRIRKYCP